MSRLIKQAMIGIMMIPSVAFGSGVSAISEPTPIILDTDSFYLWHTATGGLMRIKWEFPLNATLAHLSVTGRTVKLSIPDITDGFADINLPLPASARDEDVINLKLSFNDGSVKTSSLGLVRGFAGGSGVSTSTKCLASADSSLWKYAEKRFVVPVPQGTKSLMIAGDAVDTGLDGAAGWLALGPYLKDTVLSVSADSSNFDLLVTSLGLVINFR
jgi:hypothetical protein